MKKTLYTSVILSALVAISPAAAEVTDLSLTTKGYVDAGLSYVHGEVGDLNTVVSGHTSSISTLNSQVSALQTATSGISGQAQSITALETAVGQAAHEEGGQQVAATGIYAALEGKQDALSQTQQNAVNSGVTSATVAQVATNTSNISTLQGQVSSLQTAQQSAQNLGDGAGIDVVDNTINVNGLNAETAEDNKIYVFKNNQAVELSTATTWTGFGS